MHLIKTLRAVRRGGPAPDGWPPRAGQASSRLPPASPSLSPGFASLIFLKYKDGIVRDAVPTLGARLCWVAAQPARNSTCWHRGHRLPCHRLGPGSRDAKSKAGRALVPSPPLGLLCGACPSRPWGQTSAGHFNSDIRGREGRIQKATVASHQQLLMLLPPAPPPGCAGQRRPEVFVQPSLCPGPPRRPHCSKALQAAARLLLLMGRAPRPAPALLMALHTVSTAMTIQGDLFLQETAG